MTLCLASSSQIGFDTLQLKWRFDSSSAANTNGLGFLKGRIIKYAALRQLTCDTLSLGLFRSRQVLHKYSSAIPQEKSHSREIRPFWVNITYFFPTEPALPGPALEVNEERS